MNSRQRRQDRRLWKYRVVTQTHDFEDYVAQWQWLDQRHGKRVVKCGWRDRDHGYGHGSPYHTVWEFIHAQDATEFALRWA